MRYGTIPLAASVGGMRDFIPETAGYFMGSLSARGAPGQMAELVTQLVFTVQDALADYGTEEFRRRRRECMACDMGWRRPAELWSEALVGLATMPARREA